MINFRGGRCFTCYNPATNYYVKKFDKVSRHQGCGPVVGDRLPEDFSEENDLKKGTRVLLTFRDDDRLEAEIVPSLSRNLAAVSKSVLKRRRGAYDKLKRIGD